MKKPLLFCLATAISLTVMADDLIEQERKPVRPLATDRPDQTEGAFSVPKGWFQIESGLLSYSRRLDTGYRDESFTWGEVNFKYGITDSADIQLIWQPYIQNRQLGAPGMGSTNQAGVSDLLVRLKWNIVGNDGGDFAMALLPFVKIPTATHHIGNDMWEGGIAVNTQVDLGGGWSVGNSFFATLAINDDDEHYFKPMATCSLAYAITERLGCYNEIFGAWQYDDERFWQTSFDAGLTYLVTPNVQLDIGANWFFRGERAINPFAGISFRF